MPFKHQDEVKAEAYNLIREGLTYTDISARLGVADRTLARWFGPARNKRPRKPPDKRRTAKEEFEKKYHESIRLRMQEGKTNGEIARILGVSLTFIYTNLGPTPRRLGGRKTWPVEMRGRAHYLREVGYTVQQISDEIGVPTSTVGEWVEGMPCG